MTVSTSEDESRRGPPNVRSTSEIGKPKAPDPFAKVIEAKRARFCRKWGVELIGANDDRLAKPLPDPIPGPGSFNLEDHHPLLRALGKLVGWKG